MSIFKNQDLLTITLDTGYDGLAAAEVTKILYKKPGGTTGEWQANVSGDNLLYTVQPGDIDVVGRWSFQAYFEVSGKKGYGSIVTQHIQKPIL